MQTKLNLYKSMLLPILLYGSPARCPSKMNMNTIENFLHYATCWIVEILKMLNIFSILLFLELIDMFFLFKIFNGQICIDWTMYLIRTRTPGYRTNFSIEVNYLEENGLKSRFLDYLWSYFKNIFFLRQTFGHGAQCACARIADN